MSIASSAWLGLVGIVFYVYSVDPNVQDYVTLLLTRFEQVRKGAIYSLQWNPAYSWARLNIWRTATQNADKNARRLAKELGLPRSDEY